MKGGFLIAFDQGLYRRVATAFIGLGGVAGRDDLGGEVVQITDNEGHLFTLYEKVPLGTEWEVHEELVTAAIGVALPDMKRVTACPFECRWPDMVMRLADAAARTDNSPTWLLDGDGVVWDAENVDPTRVRL